MPDAQSSPIPWNSASDTQRTPPTPKQVKSSALFDGARELRIDHDGQEYRLRQTRNGKLILTK
jgi:hemin uptake protein HemP